MPTRRRGLHALRAPASRHFGRSTRNWLRSILRFPPARVPAAANAMKAHLVKAGYPENDLHLIAPPNQPKFGNLIALLPGTDASLKPLMLLAASRRGRSEARGLDPRPLHARRRGRATSTRVARPMTSPWRPSLQTRWSASDTERYKPRRGIKLALTCGEETPNTFNGVDYLLEHHRDLIDAAFGSTKARGGRLTRIPAATLTTDSGCRETLSGLYAGNREPGGHSSRPTPDNAIYQMRPGAREDQALSSPSSFNEVDSRLFRQVMARSLAERRAPTRRRRCQPTAMRPARDTPQEESDSQRDAAYNLCPHDDDGGHALSASNRDGTSTAGSSRAERPKRFVRRSSGRSGIRV